MLWKEKNGMTGRKKCVEGTRIRVKTTVKHSGGSLMVWACVVANKALTNADRSWQGETQSITELKHT